MGKIMLDGARLSGANYSKQQYFIYIMWAAAAAASFLSHKQSQTYTNKYTHAYAG